jgi:hypothetical protein
LKFTRTNRLMDEMLLFYSKAKEKSKFEYVEFTSLFCDFILDEVICKDGFYLLQSKINLLQSEIERAIDPDHVELGVNSLKTFSFVGRESRSRYQHLNVGFALLEVLKTKLKTSFPGQRFYITFSYNIGGESEGLNDCNIRFYTPNEITRALFDDDLEQFSDEASGNLEI